MVATHFTLTAVLVADQQLQEILSYDDISRDLSTAEACFFSMKYFLGGFCVKFFWRPSYAMALFLVVLLGAEHTRLICTVICLFGVQKNRQPPLAVAIFCS